MSRNKIEYPWLKENETITYDDVNGVYHYEITCASGIHRFYISTKLDQRPMTRELIDEYASVLGLAVECNETPEEHQAHGEPTIEYDPENDVMIVNDGKGNETIHQMPENPSEYHTLDIKSFPKVEGYSLDASLSRWSEILFSLASISATKHEYENVAGYDKVIIIGDMLALYTGEDFELLKVPEYDWDRRLIMSDELIGLLATHEQKAG